MTHLTPCEVAYVRAGGRTWILGPPTIADSLREPAAVAQPFRPAHVENLADHAGVRRLYATLAGRPDAHRRGRVEIARWVQHNLDRGWLVALDITAEGMMDTDRIQRREEASLPIPGGVPASSVFFTPQFDQPGRLPFRDRCIEAIMRAAMVLTPEMRRELYDRLDPGRLAEVATAMTQWGESQSERMSMNFSAGVFSAAYELAGWPAFRGMDHLAAAILLTREAVTDEELQLGAATLAAAVEDMGPEAFVLLGSRQARAVPPHATVHDGAVMRWGAYVERLSMPHIEARNACLWGDLPARAQALAMGQAQRQGLTTLAGFLRGTDFLHRFLCEFGPMAVTPLTRRIWEMTCIRWVRMLQGKITLFSDEGAQAGVAGVGSSSAPPLSGGDSPFAASERARTAREARLAAPALRGDLAAIAAVRNPMIQEVSVVDVGGAPIMPVMPGQLPA